MRSSLKTVNDINAELKSLYKKWPDVKRFLKSKGCNSTDAEDIFQEALLIYTRKLEDPEFELNVDAFHYVKNICKFIWYNQSRKQRKHHHDEITENFSAEEEEWFLKELKLRRIEHAIEKIGKQCQDLLKLFYGMGMSMVEIAKKIGLRNDKVAKVQKYRCIKKVKDIVLNSSEEHSIQH